MPIVKICGLTNEKDCKSVVELRPDYVGLVFAESPRRVSLEKALELRNYLISIKRVALFVNEDPGRVEEIAREIGANVLQFHGDESPEYCERFMGYFQVWKAMNEGNIGEIPNYSSSVDAIVFDALVKGKRGGTGKVADWDKALRVREDSGINVVLAGGLSPDNVAEAIRRVKPWGTDVSSGVEGDVKGEKSYEKMRDFIRAAKY